MAILAIETSARICGVALAEQQDGCCSVFYEKNLSIERVHSKMLLPLVREAMDLTGLFPADIEICAVTTGPGSFTGIRIGLSTAKALSVAWEMPIIGVDSLMAVAANADPGSTPFVVLDARRGMFYTAAFSIDADGMPSVIMPTDARTFEQAVSDLQHAGVNAPLLMGDAAAMFSEHAQWAEHGFGSNVFEGQWYPKAGKVALIAAQRRAQSKAQRPEDVTGTYFRRFQAGGKPT